MMEFLFWGWVLILLVLNTLPLGNDLTRSMVANNGWFRLDYLVHFVSFLGFSWLYLVGLVISKPIGGTKRVLVFSLVTLSCAVFFEVVQVFLPYRSFNPIDLLYNVLGAITSVTVVVLSDKRGKAI